MVQGSLYRKSEAVLFVQTCLRLFVTILFLDSHLSLNPYPKKDI
jgi:hypothetical protein